MASKCRSFFVISVYLKSRNFYFATSFFDIKIIHPPKISPSAIFWSKNQYKPCLIFGETR